ncbi:hypothetical protein GCM10027052_02100 [Parafrigoribacterium mesophilum]|uniref:acyl-CoA carboxylase subunit epsilon n=1 Tax=Parafrigoribacterium mesophilum TaxID=433646 RepID=UPI0031FBE3E5
MTDDTATDTTGGPTTGAATTPEPEPLLHVVSGTPTPDELAAVAAVIEGLVRESAARRREAKDAGPSAWERSQRPIAVPIVPSRGGWNRAQR